jgi:putative redox protein
VHGDVGAHVPAPLADRAGEVVVRVGIGPGPVLVRTVVVDAVVEPDLREQLSAEVDSTPVTRLLRDAVPIRTVLTTGAPFP